MFVTGVQTCALPISFTFHFHALEKEMATHSSVLAWRIPGTGESDFRQNVTTLHPNPSLPTYTESRLRLETVDRVEMGDNGWKVQGSRGKGEAGQPVIESQETARAFANGVLVGCL